MTTIEMLNSIASNNFKMPKSADWKSAEIPAASNFCTHLEKAWINFMKGMVYDEDKYFEMADERLSTAFSCLNIVPTEMMIKRLEGLCQIKRVKDKVRYTSKTTFRKNALVYLHDCVNGENCLEADEKLEKALGVNGCTVKQVSPEKQLERNVRRFNKLFEGLSDEAKASLIAEIAKAA